MTSILLLNGPNLNLLGTREPEVYGRETLADLVANLSKVMDELGGKLEHCQSNHEGVLIDAIHQARGVHDGILINPGAFTHYSYAIRDALSSVALPTIEIHISNIHAREEFRHHSVLAPIVIGQVVGLGMDGYEWALRALVRKIEKK
ncbi:3-dehydroquinate dehydratase [Brevibacillus reuszeri]|uniref:3-dehydroquinate dehydratase n=1 Tax=Brevibacillus reuszeri TaxID=54915 RepID=A0A0K9YRF3_9BACL|nr:type II 3-dehydroquinate dehydratase [Brevibacillus reuszeri]KNB71222.1 3-dehydroquinate dehydratase [Brevibacillus reuszeri]MED1857658.1 type II 3-dehydroquinate dehydratase [Brevibacillus reuszeri]GED66509.1 3-dehydroquinate dehydratase [Brevibacillus reuszeri]